MFKEIEAQFTEWFDLHSIQIHIKDPSHSNEEFLPGVFKASCKVGEQNRLQSQEANCTLPVGCTRMSLICLEWRRKKL